MHRLTAGFQSMYNVCNILNVIKIKVAAFIKVNLAISHEILTTEHLS